LNYQTLTWAVADGILTLTLNRPEQLNAFTVEMADELVDAFGIMVYPAALIVTMPYYYMKDATRGAKAFVVVVSLLILAAASYLAALI